ncbi:S8 family peptidase [Microbacterium binotii]|uniref:S8 family peptidase n=1 Tax=Microbacterium binotii TaxID=462710 RepID=UPI001F21F613|nr:S8/S53 family peptidase [Microbacterium binotii]UIN30308.1 S8/S53 family peptidase [Microbacterium binotii]
MAAIAALAVVVPATPAAAADGQWWYDVYDVAGVHAEGWTGEGVKIAVVDSQINPELPDFAGADLTVAPGAACEGAEPSTTEANAMSEHGSTVTAMLVGNGTGVAGTKGIVPDASVTFYGVGALAECTPTPEVDAAGLTPVMWMIQRALDDGADIIMTAIVIGMPGANDHLTVAKAAAMKVPIVAGNPNNGIKEGIYPAGLNAVIAVSGVDIDGNLAIGGLGVPNAILDTTVVAPGVDIAVIGDGSGSWNVSGRATGTSLATPQVAGILAAAKQKYPSATGNQLMQSLVHNTGKDDHPLEYSATGGFGFGAASLQHVLSKDPTQYDDVNPVLGKGTQVPSPADVEAAASALESPAPTGPDAPDAPEGSGASILPVILGVGVGVLILIIAAVVVTVVLVRRSNSSQRKGQP